MLLVGSGVALTAFFLMFPLVIVPSVPEELHGVRDAQEQRHVPLPGQEHISTKRCFVQTLLALGGTLGQGCFSRLRSW